MNLPLCGFFSTKHGLNVVQEYSVAVLLEVPDSPVNQVAVPMYKGVF